MENSIIAWTNYTFNPWMGCIKVSPGCKNCYAETLTKNRMGLNVWGTAPRQRTSVAYWKQPLQWNKIAANGGPNKVFCASLADIFEDNDQLIPWRNQLWVLIMQTPNLEWQLLTKRPENIKRFSPDILPQNVWLGTSIENEEYAFRADILRGIKAKIRFISYEPALGPLASTINLNGIHWVIYGGESGKNFRKEDKQWARDMRAKCIEHNVAFFHKQSAAWRTEMGIELDGETIRNFPDEKYLSKIFLKELLSA